MMNIVLLVVRPFGLHGLGHLIMDAAEIQATVAGEHAHDVIRVMAPTTAPASREEN